MADSSHRKSETHLDPERKTVAQTSQPTPVSSRDKIIEIAEPLFAQLGFAGVGMRELADRVGMSKSALFHHFPTKVALYVAVLESALARIDTSLLEGDDDSALDRMRRWVDSLIDTLAEHPVVAPLLLRTFFEVDIAGPDEMAPCDEMLERIIGRVSNCLKEGVASGELNELSVPHTIQSLVGMTVFHFASGEFGETLFGQSVFSAEEVRARKAHVRSFIDRALARRT